MRHQTTSVGAVHRGMTAAWSSLVEEDDCSYLPNCQINLVIAFHALSLFFTFHKHNSLTLGRYQPSSPISCRAPFLLSDSIQLVDIQSIVKFALFQLNPVLILFLRSFSLNHYLFPPLAQLQIFFKPFMYMTGISISRIFCVSFLKTTLFVIHTS